MALLARYSKTGWTATATSNYGGSYTAMSAIDDNVNSAWATLNNPPQSLVIDMKVSQPVACLEYLPRSVDHIRGFEIYLSNDGVNWGSPVVAEEWAPFSGTTLQHTGWASQSARYVKLTAVSSDPANMPVGASEIYLRNSDGQPNFMAVTKVEASVAQASDASNVRVTQEIVEVAAVSPGNTLITQVVAEVARPFLTNGLISQVVAEIAAPMSLWGAATSQPQVFIAC